MRAGRQQGTVAVVVALAIAAAATVAGCGATHAISGAVDPVAQAATTTSHAAGYRMSATIDATGAGVTVHGTMAGAIDSTRHLGAFTQRESVAGQSISIAVRQSGTIVYMRVPTSAALAHLTGGKPWVKLDFGRALGAFGLGGLPTQSTDPSQWIDYLRTVGAKPKRVGTEPIDGSQTTHYHVVVNLDNYPTLFPPARRAAAARGVATLESALGTHSMQMDAWVDAHNLLRRMSFSMGECVQSRRVNLGMTMNLSDYGPQTVPAAPSPSEAYDLTPLILKSLKSFKPGICGGPTA